MKVTCESCGAKYTIADEKVQGRRVKVRCKSCSTAIIVDGTQALTSYNASEEEATHVVQGAPSFSDFDAAPNPDMWCVNLSDTDQRDMTTPEIIEGWQSGLVTEDAFVWKEGMADWVPVLEVGELAVALGPSQPGSATPALPTFGQLAPTGEAARVTGGRTGGADLFGGIHTAGSEAETQAAPEPGSTPYIEQKPTGARNESSVLFSLDALKAGFGSAPSHASSAKPSAPSQPKPMEKADLDALMGIGGGAQSPLFGLATDQALLTAPARPEPAPASVLPMAHSTTYGGPSRPNRKMLIGVGAGVVAVVIVIFAVALHHGSGNQNNAVAAADKSASPADSTPSDKNKPAASAQVAEKPSASAPAASSAPPANLPPFDKKAALKALGVADKQAKACKKPGGPTGTGKVVFTIETSGKVTNAKVSGGHYEGTDVAKCVADVFRKVEVPAFKGKPITAARHFDLP